MLFREPELLFLLFMPFVIGLVLKVGVPAAALLLDQIFGFNIRPHLPFILGFLMLVPPLLVGMIIGFRLMDDRDAGVLRYIAVTPLGTGRYLLYRLIVPWVLSIPLTWMLPFFLKSEYSPKAMLAVAVLSSFNAPLLTLFITAFAGNKVEGAALSKVSGMLFLAPVGGYLIRQSWAAVLMVFPPYWTPLAVVRIERHHSFILFLTAGCCVSVLWIILFLHLLRRRQRL